MSLITNTNIKLEFRVKLDLELIIIKYGGVLKSDYHAALRHIDILTIASFSYLITLLIYSTVSAVIITNFPFHLEDINLINTICTQLLSKIFEMINYGQVKNLDKSVKIHGSKVFDSFKLKDNYALCSLNNITISFKSKELIKLFTENDFSVIMRKLENKISSTFFPCKITFVDNRDFFPAAKITINGEKETSKFNDI